MEQHRARFSREVMIDPLNYLIYTPFGRLLKIPAASSRGDLKRKSANYPIQSAAGDITNLAMHRLERRFKALGMRTRCRLAIHDATYNDAPLEEVEVAKIITIDEMMRTKQLPWLGCIPLATELQVGPSLGELEEHPKITSVEWWDHIRKERVAKLSRPEQEIVNREVWA